MSAGEVSINSEDSLIQSLKRDLAPGSLEYRIKTVMHCKFDSYASDMWGERPGQSGGRLNGKR